MNGCALELWVDGAWHVAGALRVDAEVRGVESASSFDYDDDYLIAQSAALGAIDARAVSCRYPVGYAPHRDSTWPPFALDLIPTGAARRHWVSVLELYNAPGSDWPVLINGGGNPPGNLRVCEAAERLGPTNDTHPGFARSEITQRAQGFLEYARERGASIAGGSGAGGDAPKFLLREDHEGRFHADGALADARTRRCWIVKFPRSSRRMDRLVLENEASYWRVAARLGARVADPPMWEDDCLFVPRFDRVVSGGAVTYLGLESLTSLAGVAAFGVAIPKERLAEAVAKYATDPATELEELLVRDVLDVAMNNTDNHARNTAVLKTVGSIAISPLFDFGPMFLDTEGIARVCRWSGEKEGFPDYTDVVRRLEPLGLDRARAVSRLSQLAAGIRGVARIMDDERVTPEIVEMLDVRLARVASSLEKVR